jgi:hypothetical protein
VAWRCSIEHPLLINGYAYLAVSLLINGYAYLAGSLLINGYAHLAVSLPDNGSVASNAYATDITDRCLGSRLTNRRPDRGNGSSHITINPLNPQRKS